MEAVNMKQQGCCTLAVDESDRILDRLAGLEKVITPQMIEQALNTTGRVGCAKLALRRLLTFIPVLFLRHKH